MNPLAIDILTHLVNLGILVGVGKDCFANVLPQEVENGVSCAEVTGGQAPLNIPEVRRQIVFYIRNKDDFEAYKMVWEIYNALQDKGQIVINGRQMNFNTYMTPYIFDRHAGLVTYSVNFSCWTDKG